jgi:predicted transposase/invertase (TIGR01784 family)
MAQQYDRIIKENLQSVIFELLRRTTDVRMKEYKLIFPELPKTIGREADFVIQAKNADGDDEIIHLEFQTFNDDLMLERMLLYFGLLRYIYRLPIRQFVFYIGQGELKMSASYQQPNVSFSYGLVNLEAISYRDFIASDNPEMVILAILTDFEDKQADWIVARIFEKLIALDTNPTELQKHIRQLDILAILRNLQKTVINQEKAMGLTLNIENDLRFQEGKQEGIEQVVLAMLADGFDLKIISKLTKLTIAQVKQIQKKTGKP